MAILTFVMFTVWAFIRSFMNRPPGDYETEVCDIRLKDKKTRDLLKERLKADVHYSKPISENEMYKSIIHRKDNCVNCKKVTETILSLPIHPYVTDEEVDDICNIIMMTV